eukprot:6072728-Pyramimonas_sp.AAC.1
MILLGVDDFFIASSPPEVRQQVRVMLESRFRFGKYRDLRASPVGYAGRRITQTPQRSTVQEKYILEELRPLSMAHGRLRRQGTQSDPT